MQIRRAPFFLSSVAAALMLGATPVIAADTSAHQGTSSQSQTTNQNRQADARSARDAEKVWEQTHRASKLIGTEIVNAKGAKVGSVKDLVLDDPASGQVTRVVVSVGGVGGLGDKLFAVPYNALQRDTAKNRLVLTADSDLAHAFNDDNWQTLSNQAPTRSANAAATTPPAPSSTASVTPTTDTSATMSPPITAGSTSSSNTGSASSSSNATTGTGASSTSDATTTK